MSGNRLLVVEDDATSRDALRAIFTRNGWEVVTASTLAEALDRLDPAPVGIVLDLNLPDGRGEWLLRAIRIGGLDTRVAVCSGTDDPRRIADVLGLQPEAMLAKPFDLGPVLHLFESARQRG